MKILTVCYILLLVLMTGCKSLSALGGSRPVSGSEKECRRQQGLIYTVGHGAEAFCQLRDGYVFKIDD